MNQAPLHSLESGGRTDSRDTARRDWESDPGFYIYILFSPASLSRLNKPRFHTVTAIYHCLSMTTQTKPSRQILIQLIPSQFDVHSEVIIFALLTDFLLFSSPCFIISFLRVPDHWAPTCVKYLLGRTGNERGISPRLVLRSEGADVAADDRIASKTWGSANNVSATTGLWRWPERAERLAKQRLQEAALAPGTAGPFGFPLWPAVLHLPHRLALCGLRTCAPPSGPGDHVGRAEAEPSGHRPPGPCCLSETLANPAVQKCPRQMGDRARDNASQEEPAVRTGVGYNTVEEKHFGRWNTFICI